MLSKNVIVENRENLLHLQNISLKTRQYYSDLSGAINGLDYDSIDRANGLILQTWLNGNAVFVAGNGGSWATATHLVADLTKTIYGKTPYTLIEHYPFTIENLGDNVPLMTAVANDLPDGFEHIFSLPLASKGKSGDLLLVITGSGNSKNIIRVLQMAKKIGMTTVGWLGFDGGQAKDLCDDTIVIDSKDYGIIEDMHSTLMHNITNYLKLQLAELQTQLQ